jgi:hypothetical protein
VLSTQLRIAPPQPSNANLQALLLYDGEAS